MTREAYLSLPQRLRNQPDAIGDDGIQASFCLSRGIIGPIIQFPPRNTHKPSILYPSDESRADDQRLRSADDPSQPPPFCEPYGFPEAVGPGVRGRDMPRFGQEVDRVDVLLAGEEDADLGAEGGEEDGAVLGEMVNAVEDVVD